MAKVLTENQSLLTRYLAAVGCDKGAVFEIMLKLWHEEAIIEMLEFCREHHPASQAELLEASSKIYLKYKEEIDSIPEWGDEESEEGEE